MHKHSEAVSHIIAGQSHFYTYIYKKNPVMRLVSDFIGSSRGMCCVSDVWRIYHVSAHYRHVTFI